MRIHRFHVSPSLPRELAALDTLTRDCWYSWHPEVGDLLERIDPVAWERSGRRPAAALNRMSGEALIAAAAVPSIRDEVKRLSAALELERANARVADDGMLVAYFSCEFGLDQGLPIYSGGLGLLAGDHLKAASNLGLPLVGVGLLYRGGYFRQELTADGWQVERYPVNEPADLPIVAETDERGAPLMIGVDLAGERVHARIWRAQVGGVALYLLDTDVADNTPEARAITDRLYGGDREHRIRQELVLGIGGVRALDAVGLRPTVFHMNEGHSAFLALERLRVLIREHRLGFDEAIEVTRASTVFTTHTPVPAGNEVFETDLAVRYLAPLVEELGAGYERLARLGAIAGAEDQRLGMTVLALQTSARANGVSALHGEVSRRMWRGIWPGRLVTEVPIGSVTNGVHTQSWLGPEMRRLLLGRGLERVLDDPAASASWAGVSEVGDDELWLTRGTARQRLVRLAHERAGARLDPDALTIGFSRRFASYKRAGLLLSQPDRLLALLNDRERPVQLVMAGKAHPADDPGKAVIQEVIRFARDPRVRGRVAFLHDYDIATAKVLVQGADVWLNTPRRPQEASGTSGMKAALNGVLNLSILDGWWPEGYGPSLGWAIGDETVPDDPEAQDVRDAESLYRVLEEEVVPAFYDRAAGGVPERWLQMMRACMQHLGPQFSAQRMVAEYAERYYRPAHLDGARMAADDFEKARAAAARHTEILATWPQVCVSAEVELPPAGAHLGDAFAIRADVELGPLTPDDVVVEALLGEPDSDGDLDDPVLVALAPVGAAADGRQRYEAEVPTDRAGAYGVAVRVRPSRNGFAFAPDLVAIERPVPEPPPADGE